MKITDSEVIKNSEAELIDAITGDLDWQAIETILKEKHKLGLQDEVEYREGDLVIHDNQIAYKLDFDVKVTLSVLFDRQGNCLKLSTSNDMPDSENDDFDSANQQPHESAEDQRKGFNPEPSVAVSTDARETGSSRMAADALPRNQETTEGLNQAYDTASSEEKKSESLTGSSESSGNISQMASEIAEMITEINK